MAGQLTLSPAGDIRRTDNVASILSSPVEAFVKRMKNFPETDFYLATDDEHVKSQLIREFGNRIHHNASAADRATKAGMKEAVTELSALAETDYFTGSYCSSFSDIALSLCGKVEIIKV